jgi:hypothetical protein
MTGAAWCWTYGSEPGWAVENPKDFDVVTVPAADGGVLVVPVEEFARRWAVMAR